MEHPAAAADKVTRGISSRIALLMLCVVGGTCLILSGLAQSRSVLDWIRNTAWEQAGRKQQIPMACYTEHFIDCDDRLLHQDIPSADYSRGGVYFLGASNLAWALKLWDLPAEYRSLIHNYSIPGMSHADQFDLLRFLVERKGLLNAGGERTLIVFGVSFHNTHLARLTGVPIESVVRAWTRRGFYTVDADGTLGVSTQNGLVNMMIVERTKLTGLMKELVNIAYTPFKRPRVQTPQRYIREWSRVMEDHGDWRVKIQVDTAAFARTVDYLLARNAQVAVVRMPHGSWDRDSLYEQFYIDQIRKICEPKNIKIHDLSALIPDAEFADSVHLVPAAIEKFQGAVINLCVGHLRSAGVLDAGAATEKAKGGRRITGLATLSPF